MTTLREAAQQALEALEEYQYRGAPFLACDGAVAALKAALTQQEEPVEPVATLIAQRDALRAELKEATEAINDPAVNNLRTLPESIRVLCVQRDALLEALKPMIDLAEFWINHRQERRMSEGQYKVWIALGHESNAMLKARAAIAKAEGGQ